MTRVVLVLTLLILSFHAEASVAEASVAVSALSHSETTVEGKKGIPASRDPRQQAALDRIPFPWRELGFEIVFLPAKPGFRAMTYGQKKRIEIYVRPGDDDRMLAYDIAHELGHAIDVVFNTSATRTQWKEARGIDPATPWFGCSRCSDYKTPSGDFAETFSLILLGPEHFKGRIAPPPTPAQIPLLMRFFPMISAE